MITFAESNSSLTLNVMFWPLTVKVEIDLLVVWLLRTELKINFNLLLSISHKSAPSDKFKVIVTFLFLSTLADAGGLIVKSPNILNITDLL